MKQRAAQGSLQGWVTGAVALLAGNVFVAIVLSVRSERAFPFWPLLGYGYLAMLVVAFLTATTIGSRPRQVAASALLMVLPLALAICVTGLVGRDPSFAWVMDLVVPLLLGSGLLIVGGLGALTKALMGPTGEPVGDPVGRRARADGPLAVTSGLLFVIAVVFFAVALSMADPSDGANIGAGIAIMSAMAALAGAALSVLIPRITSPAAQLFPTILGWLAVGFAAKGLLLIAAGIIEELSRGG